VRLGHRPVVERLVEDLLLDALLARDLAQRPPGGGGLLDDLGRPVVADVGVERRRRRERQVVELARGDPLGRDRDPLGALLLEQPQLAVDAGGGRLDPAQSVCHRQRDRLAGDGEVRDRLAGLGAPDGNASEPARDVDHR
jgi:hypothetical protein